MPRSRPRPQPSPETVSLALPTFHERLAELELEHGRLLARIHKKRRELENFVVQIRSLANRIYLKIESSYQKRSEIDREIHQHFQEILHRDTLGRQSRQKIEKAYRTLQVIGMIGVPPDEEDPDAELDEMFEEPADSPRVPEGEGEAGPARKSEEGKKIRRTFLRLAENFHPDKVTDVETRARHTEIMKELNRAYRENDLARMLEIERKHLEGTEIAPDARSEIERRCELLEEQNQILKLQHENLKKELRAVKNSPEGALVADYRQAARANSDLVAKIEEEVGRELEELGRIRDLVRDFKDSQLSLNNFLRELLSPKIR
jgi:murein DD-endopeptidase MepM/ murein hydrolase activator NlpD